MVALNPSLPVPMLSVMEHQPYIQKQAAVFITKSAYNETYLLSFPTFLLTLPAIPAICLNDFDVQ